MQLGDKKKGWWHDIKKKIDLVAVLIDASVRLGAHVLVPELPPPADCEVLRGPEERVAAVLAEDVRGQLVGLPRRVRRVRVAVYRAGHLIFILQWKMIYFCTFFN